MVPGEERGIFSTRRIWVVHRTGTEKDRRGGESLEEEETDSRYEGSSLPIARGERKKWEDKSSRGGLTLET